MNTKENKIEWKISSHLVDYQDALEEMEQRVQAIQEQKAPELIWLLEHPPLYTAGTSAKSSDLLSPLFPVYKSGRGGEYTYHGPGQRVAYVLLNLNNRKQDLRWYVATLEQWIIDALAQFNLTGERREGRVGIWVPQAGQKEEKIAAIGIRVRRWVTFHGLSINVSPDLENFQGIVPCGLSGYGVTSFEKLGYPITVSDVDLALKKTCPF